MSACVNELVEGKQKSSLSRQRRSLPPDRRRRVENGQIAWGPPGHGSCRGTGGAAPPSEQRRCSGGASGGQKIETPSWRTVFRPSLRPSRRSDLSSSHVLSEDYLPKSSPLQSAGDEQITPSSIYWALTGAAARPVGAGDQTKSTVRQKKRDDWFPTDAGPEPSVVKMSRGEQLQPSLTWKSRQREGRRATFARAVQLAIFSNPHWL